MPRPRGTAPLRPTITINVARSTLARLRRTGISGQTADELLRALLDRYEHEAAARPAEAQA